MTDQYRNKYRIESNRLPGWDYSRNGYYFVTVVTHNRQCIFGIIANNRMNLSVFGKIAYDEWCDSFKIRHELILHDFVLMPNHLHAIVVLYNNDRNVETHGRASLHSDKSIIKPNIHINSVNDSEINNFELPRKPKSISSFVAGYKSSVINTIDNYIDNNNLSIQKFNRSNPLWQSNYHDHIIRNKKSYNNISNYIIENPIKWNNDKFYIKDNINCKN